MDIKKHLPAIIIIIGIVVVAAVIGVWALSQINIQNDVNVSVPAALTVSTTQIDWGNMSQGESKTFQVTLANSGDDSTGPLNIVCPTGIAFGSLSCLDGTTVTVDGHSNVTIDFMLMINADATPGEYPDFGDIVIG